MACHAPNIRPQIPRADIRHVPSIRLPPLIHLPSVIDPVFDIEQSGKPLAPFDEKHQEFNYGLEAVSDEFAEPPTTTHDSDPYLYPTLARNERARLTTVWYHTKGIETDQELLTIIDNIVHMVQKCIGWEIAICGILDESTYLRVAAVNIQLARVPRRESTCSHTITQAAGSVLMVTDLSRDWRFRCSPQVEFGGLRSYAGTQLRMTTEDGQDIAIGSLCVASNTPQATLSEEARFMLIRFASLVTSEIVNRTRYNRWKQRQVMSDVLAKLRIQMDVDDFDKILLHGIRQLYSDAHVTIQDHSNEQIYLENRPQIMFNDAQEGLWEDITYIEDAIRSSNFESLSSSQTVRAIMARCGSMGKFIVVSSCDVQLVFDSFDAWFIERCASMKAEQHQNRQLQHALRVKENFLRGITHQLRTPIHGVLGSVELLAEELAAISFPSTPEERDINSTNKFSPSMHLTTIKNSGQELMTTVNNIIKLNNWTDDVKAERNDSVYDIVELEDEILYDVLQLVPEARLTNVSIHTKSMFLGGHCIVSTDIRQLKECLQSLLLNAVQAVTHSSGGVVTMTASLDDSQSRLIFDFYDTGLGVDSIDHERIFNPYEKIDTHKPGAGLGLTLAKKFAKTLNGSVSLIDSSPNNGSHFRADFTLPLRICPENLPKRSQIPKIHLPPKFVMIRSPTYEHMLDHLATHLLELGFQQSVEHLDDTLLITDDRLGIPEVAKLFQNVDKGVVVIRVSSKPECYQVQNYGAKIAVVTVTGPFYRHRLNDIIMQIGSLYQSLNSDLQTEKTNSEKGVSKCTSAAGKLSRRMLPQRSATVIPTVQSTLRMNIKSNLKALLVDDNLINLRILETFCQKREIPYILAEDGHQAIEAFQAAAKTIDPVTLVLMDLQMPNCDGLEATRSIRAYEVEHELPRSPIFMITGQDTPKDKSSAQRAGSDEFLVKPASLKTLEMYISKYFNLEDSTR